MSILVLSLLLIQKLFHGWDDRWYAPSNWDFWILAHRDNYCNQKPGWTWNHLLFVPSPSEKQVYLGVIYFEGQLFFSNFPNSIFTLMFPDNFHWWHKHAHKRMLLGTFLMGQTCLMSIMVNTALFRPLKRYAKKCINLRQNSQNKSSRFLPKGYSGLKKVRYR